MFSLFFSTFVQILITIPIVLISIFVQSAIPFLIAWLIIRKARIYTTCFYRYIYIFIIIQILFWWISLMIMEFYHMPQTNKQPANILIELFFLVPINILFQSFITKRYLTKFIIKSEKISVIVIYVFTFLVTFLISLFIPPIYE